jgi:hypothetical protein
MPHGAKNVDNREPSPRIVIVLVLLVFFNVVQTRGLADGFRSIIVRPSFGFAGTVDLGTHFVIVQEADREHRPGLLQQSLVRGTKPSRKSVH